MVSIKTVGSMPRSLPCTRYLSMSGQSTVVSALVCARIPNASESSSHIFAPTISGTQVFGPSFSLHLLPVNDKALFKRAAQSFRRFRIPLAPSSYNASSCLIIFNSKTWPFPRLSCSVLLFLCMRCPQMIGRSVSMLLGRTGAPEFL